MSELLEHGNIATLIVVLTVLVAAEQVITGKLDIQEFLVITGGAGGLLGIGRGIASSSRPYEDEVE